MDWWSSSIELATWLHHRLIVRSVYVFVSSAGIKYLTLCKLGQECNEKITNILGGHLDCRPVTWYTDCRAVVEIASSMDSRNELLGGRYRCWNWVMVEFKQIQTLWERHSVGAELFPCPLSSNQFPQLFLSLTGLLEEKNQLWLISFGVGENSMVSRGPRRAVLLATNWECCARNSVLVTLEK